MSLDGDVIDLLLSDSEEEGSDSFYASSLSEEEEEDEDEQSESPLNEDTSSEESDVDSDDDGDGFFLNYREMEESDSSHSSSSSEEEREEEEESYTSYNTFEDPRSPLAAADSPTLNEETSSEESDVDDSDGDGLDLLLSQSEEEGSHSFYESSFSEEEEEQSESPLDEDISEEESDGDDSDDDEEEEGSFECNGSPQMSTSLFSFSADKILEDGLLFAGFIKERINRCGAKRNTDHFKAFYGVGPHTFARFATDLFNKHPDLKYKDVFMTTSWLKTYQTTHVMSATWGYCVEYIGPVVKSYVAKFSSLKEGKIHLDRFEDEPIIIFSVDNCHFMTDEMALDPSNKWYDFKKGGAGLKYEIALSIYRDEVISIRGPLPCSVHDVTMFRGGTAEDKKKKKMDKNALYFQIPPGKKGVGDSGYSGEPSKIVTTRKGQSMELKRWLGRVKSRQETFFSRMKGYSVLQNRFRHGKRGTEDKMKRHKHCVESVAVLMAYDIEVNPLMKV